MKCSRRRPCFGTGRPVRRQSAIDERKSELESEVRMGTRDARTLVAVPAELARGATLRFPGQPFGEPEPW